MSRMIADPLTAQSLPHIRTGLQWSVTNSKQFNIGPDVDRRGSEVGEHSWSVCNVQKQKPRPGVVGAFTRAESLKKGSVLDCKLMVCFEHHDM